MNKLIILSNNRKSIESPQRHSNCITAINSKHFRHRFESHNLFNTCSLTDQIYLVHYFPEYYLIQY